ncbi:MAG: hypothetical protein WC378_07740 [Opitutaceae bacterium]|jgi:hypothetical protein
MNQTKHISAEGLDRKFDAGESVLEHFDLSKATRGGKRIGAGRKPAGKLRKTVKLSPAAIARFRAYAKRSGLRDFSAAIEKASTLVKIG